jgi:limonene-1,2-epoxide hydrolase
MYFFTLFALLISFSTWGQSMKDLGNKEKIQFFFEKLSKDNMSLVEDFYHPLVDFTDPIGHIKGSEKIKAYYGNMYKNVKSINFKFTNFHEAGDTVVAIWTMTLETEQLNGGTPYSVAGNSVIKFDEAGKVIYHRDYFDMGAFIYERLPVLGFVIKKIKKRLEAE